MILITKGISFIKVSGAAWLAQLGKRRFAEHEVRLNWKSTLAHATLHITISSYNLVPALKDTANKCTSAWEFKKPLIFCFIMLHSDKDKWTIWVEYICCWFSPLLQEVFFQVLRFSPLFKTNIYKCQLHVDQGW